MEALRLVPSSGRGRNGEAFRPLMPKVASQESHAEMVNQL